MKVVPFLAIAVLAAPSLAQTAKSAEVFSGQKIGAQLANLEQTAKPSGSSGATLGDYQSHSIRISVRTASGGAEVHSHFDDIFVVTNGSATLITGGSVINPQTGVDGEIKGTRIQDGTAQKITKNDVVHVPAGVPHQLIIDPGNTFGAIVVKVRE